MGVLIHSEPKIPWHGPFAKKMQAGLANIGIESRITPWRSKDSDVSILLGTTLWRNIEAGGNYLLVDRCSFGDTNQWVSLVWNGHGRRGDHRVPRNRKSRNMPELEQPLQPWRTGRRVVLCGQTEPYSPHYRRLLDWYSEITNATHFRKHPAGMNPTNLPPIKDWDDVGLCVTLNSSIGVEAVFRGIPTVTMDEAAMAWDVTGHTKNSMLTPERRPWLEWLSWTQWHHDEIEAGKPIKHLFEAI